MDYYALARLCMDRVPTHNGFLSVKRIIGLDKKAIFRYQSLDAIYSDPVTSDCTDIHMVKRN